jgi:hypothetical protein
VCCSSSNCDWNTRSGGAVSTQRHEDVISQSSRFYTSLNQGTNSKFPCPRCLVPNAEQHNLLKVWTTRTQEASKDLYFKAEEHFSNGEKAQGKALLKSQSLYRVKVSSALLSAFCPRLHRTRMRIGPCLALTCTRHSLLMYSIQFGLVFGASIFGRYSSNTA